MTMTTMFETGEGIVMQLPVEKIARVSLYSDNYSRLHFDIRMESGFVAAYEAETPNECRDGEADE